MSHVMEMSGSYGEVLDKCVACGDGEINYWRKKSFQYTVGASHREFYIYRCANCGTGFLNRPPHAQWLKSIYQYSGQALVKPMTLVEIMARESEFPNCTVDAERMAWQADQGNKSGYRRALDIGSGFGFYTRALRKLGYRTVSINPGAYENQVFRDLNGDEAVPMMFEDFKSSERFGVVIMSQVLEHLLEPDRAVKKVADLLGVGGVLACAVPNYGSFWVKLLGTKDNACLWVPEHVNYFTVHGLTALIERNGLRVLKVEQVTRIPYNAISRRLRLTGKAAVIADTLVRYLQIPFARLMNLCGMGIYINLYAIKKF